MDFTITIGLISLLAVLYYYFKHYSFTIINDSHQPRRLKPQWLLAVAMVTSRKAFHEAIAKLKEKYGDMFSIRIGTSHVFFLSRIDHIQHVLCDRHTYDASETTTRNFSLLFPSGIIALRGDAWKRHARIMLPMFKRNKILPYFDTIVRCIDRFIDQRFSQQSGSIHTDLVTRCQQLLLNIIAQIAFNYDFESLSSSDGTNLPQAFNDMIRRANQFALMLGLPLWIAKLILALDFKFQRALRITKQYVMNIINNEQRRQRQQQHMPAANTQKNLISSLVGAADYDPSSSSSSMNVSLTSDEVSDEVSMSILAAFETTSTALSWFIFFMSKYPEVQQKIRDELKVYHLASDVPLTEDALDGLVYVECVTKEVLRFAPIAAGIVRQATRDDILDGIQVKKGDTFLIAIQNVHRDPRYWKIDPSKFVPERFLDEDRYPPSYAYMPFGGGHRACIGQDLAFLELKIAIARLMQRISIEDVGKEANNSGGFLQRVTCFPKHMAVRVFYQPQSDNSSI